MGVSTKGRRKITVNNKEYIWYIEIDCDSPYRILQIISVDKSFVVSCPIKTVTPYLISKGICFQNAKTNGTWNRYLLPFDVPETITPKFVSKIIVWAMYDKNAIPAEWKGEAIPV